MSDFLALIRQAVVEGKYADVETLVKQALEARLEVESIINESLIPAMDMVGQNFASGRIFVPEMLVSAMTMKTALKLLKPLLAGMPLKSQGKVLIATVQGDLHDVGKNLVVMMLEGAGFEVVDLGVDVSIERIISEVKNHKPDILGLSSLLTTTMPEMGKVVNVLKEKGLRNSIKIMIGGAPIDAKFAESIGADGYGRDAGDAVKQAKDMLTKKFD